MSFLAASCRDINLEISFIPIEAFKYLNSFIPIRYAIGIRSTYKFQFTSLPVRQAELLKFEFHE